MGYHNEEVLCGKKIVGVKVCQDDRHSSVWLHVDNGEWIQIEVDGDCCSQPFIDAVTFSGPVELTGKTIECVFDSEATEQEVDVVYVVVFEAVGNGSLAIMHRNSSNGYYGNYWSAKMRGEPVGGVEARMWCREGIKFRTASKL